ncbi:18294_t:CDS:2 [Acaulospora morrowiae]|uniref:18294_t:CDS:1 n=1 Tax=Acaulospora morrowiae TaxID=94023 RepID=A0A9N9CRV7_9GLOM|nr:18294_t:CDS:2 [Acaulospora morrowiae]
MKKFFIQSQLLRYINPLYQPTILPDYPQPHIECTGINNHVIAISKNNVTRKIEENKPCIEKPFREEYVKSININYNEIYVLEHMTNGSTCQIKKAMWNNGIKNIIVVLKLMEEKSGEPEYTEVIRELKVYSSINSKSIHENIIRFYGLRKEEKCCDYYPHNSSTFENMLDNSDLNINEQIVDLQLVELLQGIEKRCTNQSASEIMKSVKQNAPTLFAKLTDSDSSIARKNMFVSPKLNLLCFLFLISFGIYITIDPMT